MIRWRSPTLTSLVDEPRGGQSGASRRSPVPEPAPNKALEPTPNSLRSCVAAAIGRGSPRALGVSSRVVRPQRVPLAGGLYGSGNVRVTMPAGGWWLASPPGAFAGLWWLGRAVGVPGT